MTLNLLPVAADGTILRSHEGRRRLDLLAKTGVPLKWGRIGRDRQVFWADLKPGIYALVSVSTLWDVAEIGPTCYIFELRTTAQIEEAHRRVTQAEAALAARVAELEQAPVPARWPPVLKARRALNEAQTLRAAPAAESRAELDRRAQAAVLEAVRAAVNRADWAAVAAWAPYRDVAVDPAAADKLSELVLRAEFEVAAAEARSAWAREDWRAAAAAARRALAKASDSNMRRLADNADYARHAAEAKRLRAAGDASAALDHLREAVAIHSRLGEPDLPADTAEREAEALRELLAEVALRAARSLAAKPVATSDEIDAVVARFSEAQAGGVTDAKLDDAYQGVLLRARAPGRYLGAYTQRQRQFAAYAERQNNVVEILGALDGDTFYTVVADETVQEWRVSDPKYRRIISKGGSILGTDLYTGGVFHVGEYSFGGFPLSFLDAKTGQLNTISESGARWRGAGLTRDGRFVVLSDDAAGMELEVRHGPKIELKLDRRSGFCCALALSPDGWILAVGHGGNRLQFFEMAGGVRLQSPVASFEVGNMDWATRVWFSSDGERLAISFQDGIKVFAYPSGRLVGDFTLSDRYDLDPDMRTIVWHGTFGDSKATGVYAWDIDGRMGLGSLRLPQGESHQPTALALVGPGNTIAIGFTDGTVNLYSPQPPALQFEQQATEQTAEATQEAAQHVQQTAQETAGAAEEALTEAQVAALTVGDVNVGEQVAGVVKSVEGALQGVTDAQSAQAAVATLNHINTKLEQLSGTVTQLPDDAKKVLADMLSKHIESLKTLAAEVTAKEGLGRVIKPALVSVTAKLEDWVSSKETSSGVTARAPAERKYEQLHLEPRQTSAWIQVPPGSCARWNADGAWVWISTEEGKVEPYSTKPPTLYTPGTRPRHFAFTGLSTRAVDVRYYMIVRRVVPTRCRDTPKKKGIPWIYFDRDGRKRDRLPTPVARMRCARKIAVNNSAASRAMAPRRTGLQIISLALPGEAPGASLLLPT